MWLQSPARHVRPHSHFLVTAKRRFWAMGSFSGPAAFAKFARLLFLFSAILAYISHTSRPLLQCAPPSLKFEEERGARSCFRSHHSSSTLNNISFLFFLIVVVWICQQSLYTLVVSISVAGCCGGKTSAVRS